MKIRELIESSSQGGPQPLTKPGLSWTGKNKSLISPFHFLSPAIHFHCQPEPEGKRFQVMQSTGSAYQSTKQGSVGWDQGRITRIIPENANPKAWAIYGKLLEAEVSASIFLS